MPSDSRAVPERAAGWQEGEELSCEQERSKMPRRHPGGEVGQRLDEQVSASEEVHTLDIQAWELSTCMRNWTKHTGGRPPPKGVRADRGESSTKHAPGTFKVSGVRWNQKGHQEGEAGERRGDQDT